MFRNNFLLRVLFVGFFLPILSLDAQETNSQASGRVILDSKETLTGVTVTAVHEPTQNKYVSVTLEDGYFHFFNLKPGGPYSISFSSAGYEPLKKDNLFIHLSSEYFFLGSGEIANFFLQKKIVVLDEVLVNAKNINLTKTGIETSITGVTLKSMPSISRSLQDFVRLVPQAKVNGDGTISLAGQNNRFNAFFIDGANNNDLQGLAVNGMNSGQTGSSPVSIEALEEITVLLAPYNVQYGNFTGGSINAITRSGSNENKSSAWYYFRHENMAGKYPQPLSHFFNQTFGAWNSGALVKNKLFYFGLFERQSETKPLPYNINDYRGNSNQQQLQSLSDFLKTNYQYDPGSFHETLDDLDVTRFLIKFDWNASTRDKFMLSYRYHNAERTSPRLPSSAVSILFQNQGIILPARTHTVSFEWRRFIKKNINNRLLLTFTNQAADRKWIGQPFPTVTIFDGIGSILFGSDFNSGVFDFKGKDLNLFNAFTFLEKKHIVTIGTDLNYTAINNYFIPGFFGAYQFRNLNDFMNGASPSRLQRSFPFDDQAANLVKFHTLRTSFFMNDEIRISPDLKLNFGIRLDVNSILSKPKADPFFNDSAISVISRYYDLDGASSGETMDAHWALSPRIGAEYELPRYNINLKGGAGFFLGHIVNFWPAELFNSGIGSIDLVPQQFIPDPYAQPNSESLNLNPADYKGALNLVAKKFKYPLVFRSSLVAEKKTRNSWTFSIEGILTKNINDASFRNVNILPPERKSALPDSRNVYSTNSAPSKIELRNNGVKNPYSGIFLLTNNKARKGYSSSVSFIIQKRAKNFYFNSSYTYGNSKVLFEMTGPQTPIASQWRNTETVNGRNYPGLSTSDNELQHRVSMWIAKTIRYANNKMSTTLSVFYNGQSGAPFSYVYNNSMINDNGKRGENFDLIYIPGLNELSSMSFAPITDNNGQVLYSPEEQQYSLNAYIEKDKYLRNHRGEFAGRNAARLPFTHVIDLRLQQDFTIKINRQNISLTITYDVFNFANMLNRKWGQTWFLVNDSYPLISFESFSSTSTLSPQYQFKPFSGNPWSLQTSTIPGNSARWISQLGVKINFN